MSDIQCKAEECSTIIYDGEYCRRHKIAFERIKEGFEKWKKALGSIEWEEYLQELAGNKPGNVGTDVIAVAIQLLNG